MQSIRNRMILALIVMAWMTNVAPAQRPPGPGFGDFGPPGADKMMLLGQKPIQDELKLSDKQVKQIERQLDKQREGFEKLRELEPEEVGKKMARQAKTNETLLNKLLSPEQSKRLSQISLQQRGARALSDAEITKALKLTSSQKAKIQQIQEETRQETRTMFAQLGGPPGPGSRRRPGGPRGPGGPGPGRPGIEGLPPDASGNPEPPGAGAISEGARPPGPPRALGPAGNGPDQAQREQAFKKLEELRQTSDEKLLAVLESDQKSKWQEMLGDSFQFEMPRPDFPRGPRQEAGGEPGEK